jgi:hypothetical protein
MKKCDCGEGRGEAWASRIYVSPKQILLEILSALEEMSAYIANLAGCNPILPILMELTLLTAKNTKRFPYLLVTKKSINTGALSISKTPRTMRTRIGDCSTIKKISP